MPGILTTVTIARMLEPPRYALIGAGSRSATYLDALVGKYRQFAKLVGLCDPSPTRLAWHNQRLANEHQCPPVPTYSPNDFDRMIRERKPNAVIVTVPDYLHHDYIIRAMQAGCDVICEKPLTIDGAKLRAIFDAMNRTGRKLQVTLNARYMPEMMAVRRVILEGRIGTPMAADLSWVLDTSHGADFFRRWHREKDKSGGLLVHKASHHFDLVNWFLGSYPSRVFAMGDLKFYGREAAAGRGESYSYDRYTGAPQAANDPFAIRLDQDEQTRNLYLDAERDSGYVRDRNVFGSGITIEDTIALTARYRSGVILSYSLIAFSPWEGLRLSISGTKGRVELYARYGAHVLTGSDAERREASQTIRRLTVFPMFGLPQKTDIGEDKGGHGGADPAILNDLFSPDPGADLLGARSTVWDAAASVLVGIAANESIASGRPVDCDEILRIPDAH